MENKRDTSDQVIPSLKDILEGKCLRLNEFQFEDNCTAIVNNDFSVTWEEDGSQINIKGFPSAEEAHNFCMMGDFEKQDNSYLSIFKPEYKLTWIYK